MLMIIEKIAYTRAKDNLGKEIPDPYNEGKFVTESVKQRESIEVSSVKRVRPYTEKNKLNPKGEQCVIIFNDNRECTVIGNWETITQSINDLKLSEVGR